MNIPEYREYRTVRDDSPRGLSFGVWLLLFIVACVLVPLARCQVDIQVSRPDQTYIVVARNAQWGVSGGGSGDCSITSCGFNNNFIFPSLYAQESICISVFNSGANPVTFNLTVSGNNDPGAGKFQGNAARWSVPVAADGTTNSAGAVTVGGGTWAQFYVQSSGAARIALIFSGSAVALGGADIVVSQSQTASYSSDIGLIVSSIISNPIGTGVNITQVAGLPFTNGTSFLSGIPVQPVNARNTNVAATNPNPFMIGCVFNTAGSVGVVAVSRSQLVNCDNAGDIALAGNDGSTSPASIKVQSAANAASSSNATGTTLNGMPITTSPANWSVPVQGSASNCSASVAATATTQHCATGVEACIVATIAQTQLFVNLRDGATGAGTVKWNAILADTAGIGSCVVHEFAGGPICGTINTAMTLELSGATGAGNGCALTVKGYDVK